MYLKRILCGVMCALAAISFSSCKSNVTPENTPTPDVPKTPSQEQTQETQEVSSKVLEYSFDDTDGQMTLETVSNQQYKINYVFGK